MIAFPPYLQPGDTIAIVCPAGYLAYEKAESCIHTLQQWGFKVKTGKTLGNQFYYFSGTDEERLSDFQQMLDDASVQAILCGRGGYGISRIIDAIDFSYFKKHPKWIIGFSDITLLQTHIYAQYHISSLHAPMAAAFNEGEPINEYINSLGKALTGKRANYMCNNHFLNRKGIVSGELVGGNLSLLAHAIGTRSDINTTDKILFLEDIGEYIYSVDRMMLQLKRSGKLDNLKGLVVGGFTDMKDTVIPFGQTVYEVIFDKIKAYNYPVCFDFPVSHNRENYALKIGQQYEFSVGDTVSLIEIIQN